MITNQNHVSMLSSFNDSLNRKIQNQEIKECLKVDYRSILKFNDESVNKTFNEIEDESLLKKLCYFDKNKKAKCYTN
jgi:hypothetical protein